MEEGRGGGTESSELEGMNGVEQVQKVMGGSRSVKDRIGD